MRNVEHDSVAGDCGGHSTTDDVAETFEILERWHYSRSCFAREHFGRGVADRSRRGSQESG